MVEAFALPLTPSGPETQTFWSRWVQFEERPLLCWQIVPWTLGGPWHVSRLGLQEALATCLVLRSG